ncbi:MAG: Histidine triad (HIT) protein [Candidatus Gottesmanbacteria bacterium GW2011_GWB1_43_11]|uniref:Histidine triad (HIT) protein n=1 Tax=Candidatus Gottesmanbacteria bacterium GW2011_GWB1_43_11 TaxID=1618446 RepID=A0A0G1CM67_9BACT|nr:MAG: Histidine triad (HIT) protein [Candidatus Gottesmanbacteria bacterium GW2011_GWA2_42_16]KKS51503.1 MAG: Histidine triad (HIT) protein [Candidatus Gottesmanbacteria bacterium GW2011_GWA1_42_26]KKS80759.1 MAG: Histidine triad (HIT) protein [Candidatus Gottesmanbacteria bacterium GW2011_GWC1_43_10]KKS86589.1 MAG: Histidine triad (HIT) protein [Candidatus Gottesmanbacteria bacterium GW2011_GWB1_43_11]OGG09180.1 MAG: hypothetical protein A2699_02310 [Candidatus Gottesmanbacteria bacterium RI
MENCVFCEIVAKKAPAFIVYEDDETIAFLDRYPQTLGHLQLVPKVHHRWIYELPDIGTFFATAQKIIRVIIPVLEADHVTLGTFGREVKHAHLWIVPQYKKEIGLQEGKQRQQEKPTQLAQLLKETLGGGVS